MMTEDEGAETVQRAPTTEAPQTSAAQPEVDPARKANVQRWIKRIKDAAETYADAFKQMKQCCDIASKGYSGSWPKENYTTPILKRHVNVATAALYARNPTAVAKRKKKLLFKLWDGDYQALQAAMQAAQPQPVADPMTGQIVMGPGDPNAVALLAEVQAAHQYTVQMDRMGKTLEILFDHYINEQAMSYKGQLKAGVRRTKTTNIAWIELGFQRQMQPNPQVAAEIADITSKIARVERLLAEAKDGEIEPDSADIDELQSNLKDLQAQPELVVREGPTLSFPGYNKVIVDPDTIHLKTFAGTRWLAVEMERTPDQVREQFNVDIQGAFTGYQSSGKKADTAKLWRVQDKDTQQTFILCDGYSDFIKPPADPDVKIERFFTLFPMVFNEAEQEDVFASSEVWDARHSQDEYNRTRQGLREHRIQNRPKYAIAAGVMEETDRNKLAGAASGTVLELKSLLQGQKVDDLLQQIKTVAIDPNLYETASIIADIQRTIGSQDADLGAQSNGVTATQSSITEQGRAVTNSDNVDDLDEVLSDVAKSMGQLMLLELSPETVQEIVGPGAVWPSAPPTREQINKDLWLEIRAGSSGRPNAASELAKMERGLPYLLQLPGINPFPLGRRYGELLDLDVDEIVIEGMPSIMAQNAAASKAAQGQPGTGNGATDPAQQGDKGGNNQPSPQQRPPGPQATHQVAPQGNQHVGGQPTA